MKKILAILLIPITLGLSIVQPIQASASALDIISIGIDVYNWIQGQGHGIGEKLVDVVSNGLSSSILGHTVDKIFDSPSSAYYDNSETYNNTYNDNDYITNIYRAGDTINRSLTYTVNNTSYVYNPISNTYNNYDTYYVDNNTYYYEDNQYFYSTTNNITNVTYVIAPKNNPSELKCYKYYYELPNGSNSYNLTANDIYGQYLSYDYYQYTKASSDNSPLGLWHFDGNIQNDISNSEYTLTYGAVGYQAGKFDSAVLLNSINDDMKITGDFPDQYTLEFWFYNNFDPNYTYIGAYGSWVHCAYTYNNGVVRSYFNGVEKQRGNLPFCYYSDKQIIGHNNTVTRYFGATYSNDYENKYLGINELSYTSSTSKINFNATRNEYVYNQYLTYKLDTVTQPNTLFYPFTFTIDSVYNTYPSFSQESIDFVYSGKNGTVTGLGYESYFSCGFYVQQFAGTNVTHMLYSLQRDNTTRKGWVEKTFNEGDVCDLSDCLIDEMRLSEGILYTTNFTPPSSPFDNGEIYVAPTGGDYKLGDLALMTIVPITNVRIGGAVPPYPSNGDVYISLMSELGQSCRIYNNGAWTYCEFAVWDGSQWRNGQGFDFSELRWHDNVGSSGGDDVNINIDINVDNPNYDKKTLTDYVDFFPKVLGMLTTAFGVITILPGLKWFKIGFTVLGTLIILCLVKK